MDQLSYFFMYELLFHKTYVVVGILKTISCASHIGSFQSWTKVISYWVSYQDQ